jgi:hypothetical protein
MSLFLGLLFSSIGILYMVIGRRTWNTPYIVCGALLVIASYVVDNAALLVVVGLAISAVPHLLSRGWI